jgi:hypothetical protein
VPASGPREGYWGARLPAKVSDPRLGWREAPLSIPGLVDVDADGFQHYTPALSTSRHVVILGGSVAFGSYASSTSTTYFHLLGTELERLGQPAELTIIAAGAWKTRQEVAALGSLGERFRPGVVVLLDGLNDLTNGATSHDLYGDRVPTSDGSRWSLSYHAHDYAQRTTDYLALVDEAVEITRGLGAELLVVLQPSLVERARRTALEERLLAASLRPHTSAQALVDSYSKMRRGLEERAALGTLRFLDASRLFDHETATTFADMWHFSDPAHVILGTAMARAIATMFDGRRAAYDAGAAESGKCSDVRRRTAAVPARSGAHARAAAVALTGAARRV